MAVVKKYAGYSSSDEDEIDEGSVHLLCLQADCSLLVTKGELIEHLRIQHHRYSAFTQYHVPTFLTLAYRQRFVANGRPPSPPTFSDSPIGNTWVGAIIEVPDEKFILHVKEQDNKMHMWVSVLGQSEGANSFVCHILLVDQNKLYPANPNNRIYWRGILPSSCAASATRDGEKLSIENDILFRHFGYIKRCPVVGPGNTRRVTRKLIWNCYLILEKSIPLRTHLESIGGGEMVNPLEAITEWHRVDRKNKVAAHQDPSLFYPEVELAPLPQQGPAVEENAVAAAGEEEMDVAAAGAENAAVAVEKEQVDDEAGAMHMPAEIYEMNLTRFHEEIMNKVANRQPLTDFELNELNKALFIFRACDMAFYS